VQLTGPEYRQTIFGKQFTFLNFTTDLAGPVWLNLLLNSHFQIRHSMYVLLSASVVLRKSLNHLSNALIQRLLLPTCVALSLFLTATNVSAQSRTVTNADVVYNDDGTISVTITIADTNPVEIDLVVTPSASASTSASTSTASSGGQCVSSGQDYLQAIDNFNAQCTQPRVDCDPYDGLWYCSTANMTEKPDVVVSSITEVPSSASPADSGTSDDDHSAGSTDDSVVTSTPVVVSLPVPTPESRSAGGNSFGKIANGDLLALHYDNAPDPDDGHALVAGRVLKDFYGLESVIAVNGTHGYQRRVNFNQNSESLFDQAWPSGLNAYRDWAGSVATSAALWSETVSRGSKVWVAEGGPSDFTADVLRAMPAEHRRGVTVVQHSHGWNENNTKPSNIAYVDSQATYQRIDNGNLDGNGTADLNRQSSAFVQAALASQWGQLWRSAFNYLSPNNKLDFSDTVEFLWLLDIPLSQVANPDDFANKYLR